MIEKYTFSLVDDGNLSWKIFKEQLLSQKYEEIKWVYIWNE